MSRMLRLRTIISRHFKISNSEADILIGEGRVRVAGKAVSPSEKVEDYEEILVDGKILREAKKFSFVKFYKPRGIECTLNSEIENNLLTVFHFPQKLFPVGRLDKESEGLLLMTNDGNVFKEIAWTEREKEKEYVVRVNKSVDDDFVSAMENGIVIMGKKTKQAKVFKESEFCFRIILTQGLNRQIRRMCYKLGYEVEELIRTRIVNLELENLKSGEWVELSEEEKAELL
ncbi:hypothetical protein BH09BAC5_BH09BAC5_04030 [soil metagenome]